MSFKYINRELSWLAFNERVLDEAFDLSNPLLERFKFLSIFCSNLDEFFMVRVGSLSEQMILDPKTKDNKSGLVAEDQLLKIYSKLPSMLSQKDNAYDSLKTELNQKGIHLVHCGEYTKNDISRLRKIFEHSILPVLSPQILNEHLPFPFLDGKEIYFIANLEHKDERFMGFCPMPAKHNRIILISTDKGIRVTLIEDVICEFASEIFKNHEVRNKNIIRVTRNADISLDEAYFDHDIDWIKVMSALMQKRKKLRPVRLQSRHPLKGHLKNVLSKQIEAHPSAFYIESSPLDLSFIFPLLNHVEDRHSQFFFPNNEPSLPFNLLENKKIIPQVRKRDIMLAYPYNTITPFLSLLDEASRDSNTVSIKITLYRIASNSKIISSLLRARENGIKVTAMFELRARFDEENNINWAQQLEDAGCTVIYGLNNYKVHCKLLIIERRKLFGRKTEYITQFGTGNYNEKTSKLYTDLSIITSNEEIGKEACIVYDHLLKGEPSPPLSHIWAAPLGFKPSLIRHIENETKKGELGYIEIKCNSATDKDVIDALFEASKAGVTVKLLIRGICCLVPGLDGISHNIKVKSIVGQFLEHSRIYRFGRGDETKIFLSSADIMTRNTERRVELGVPVYDRKIKKILSEMLDLMDNDNVKSRVLGPDGIYRYFENEHFPLNSQLHFFEYFEKQREDFLKGQKHGLLSWFK